MTQAELIIEELLQRIALVEKDRAILLANFKLKEQELEDLRNATDANQPQD